jgi:hypothetical protein
MFGLWIVAKKANGPPTGLCLGPSCCKCVNSFLNFILGPLLLQLWYVVQSPENAVIMQR